MYAHVPIPDARRSDPDTYREEAAALVRIVREQCPGPKGQRPTMQQVADLLGLSDASLYQFANQEPGRRRPVRVIYPTVYALRALVAALPATRAALWGSDDGTG